MGADIERDITGDRGAPEPRQQWSGRPTAPDDLPWPLRLRLVFGWSVALVLVVAALVAPLPFSGQVVLQPGEVAPRDIIAPREVTYASEILTAQRRDLAASAVADVYDPPEARVGKQRLAQASQVAAFVATVRADTYADSATKSQLPLLHQRRQAFSAGYEPGAAPVPAGLGSRR